MACPGSLVLPRTIEKSERASLAAEWGTLCHKWLETGEVPSGRLGLTLKKKIKEGEVERDAYWSGGIHEVPLAYNVLTGDVRALVLPVAPEKKEAWKSAYGDEWAVGTADYAGLLLESPWVDDLKTGRLAHYGDYRYQQGFYTMVWAKYLAETQIGELLPGRSTITHWPKYPIGDKPRRFGTVLELEFYAELQGQLRKLREDVMRLRQYENNGERERVVVRLSDGPQCIYCPSRLACTKGQKYE